MEPLALAADEIHLWLAFYDDITDARLHARYRALLSDAERSQEPKFYFERDRKRYLVTRALVRTVLSRYAPIAPQEWIFSTNAYGRPQVANVEAQGAYLSFNVSHTYGLIALAVASEIELGVDVENLRARAAMIDVAERFFSREEAAALAAVPQASQHDRFFEYWTLKESYIKARGMGLSIPLEKFTFRYPREGRIELATHPELGDDPAHWRFWQFRPSPEYVLALCAARGNATAPAVLVRKVVPEAIEEPMMPDISRTSAMSSGATHGPHTTRRHE
ncbi:MAG: 4'-phosphopantetheinyl transferase family protein [Steroidobacteraceae bacterium]